MKIYLYKQLCQRNEKYVPSTISLVFKRKEIYRNSRCLSCNFQWYSDALFDYTPPTYWDMGIYLSHSLSVCPSVHQLTIKMLCTKWYFVFVISFYFLYQRHDDINKCYICEKGRDLTQSYDKSPLTYRKSKKQRNNTNISVKCIISQSAITE